MSRRLWLLLTIGNDSNMGQLFLTKLIIGLVSKLKYDRFLTLCLLKLKLKACTNKALKDVAATERSQVCGPCFESYQREDGQALMLLYTLC